MESLPSKEKPAELYHGSPDGNIEEFFPRTSEGSGESAGPQVYASQDKALSIMFTSNMRGIPWSGVTTDGVPQAIIPMSREEFMARDTGGYLYVLPSDTFLSDPDTGFGPKEWSSSVPVKPIKKIRIDSSLEAMIENGVRVYFVDKDEYMKVRKDGGLTVNLIKGVQSENERRQRMVK